MNILKNIGRIKSHKQEIKKLKYKYVLKRDWVL